MVCVGIGNRDMDMDMDCMWILYKYFRPGALNMIHRGFV